jgi:glycerol-3-phosphate O-acyltransferase
VTAEAVVRTTGRTRTAVLTQVTTPHENRLVLAWIRTTTAGEEVVPVDVSAGVPASLLSDPDLRLLPVRVAWLPEEHGGSRTARLRDLRPGHDPYHPSPRQQRRILSRDPDRAVVLPGEPATVAMMRQSWVETTGGADEAEFAAYVTRRAALALERAEYRLLGPRYKTPALVKEEILCSARFREGLQRLAPDGAALEQADAMLDELAAGWSRRLIDIIPTTGRMIYTRGFDPHIDFDERQVDRLRAAMQSHPGVLLWSHRSNLDNMVLTAAMQEKGLPPAHLFAGINMAFGPMGAIFRRAGVIFIRRSIGDDAVYKFVLKEYVGYVLEKRFNLSWSIEGTRSRTGKMLPPRLGLLNYAASAYLEGRTDDILLLPVSIAFDQLHEIAEYADYARGGEKKPEGFGWLYRFIKAQGERHYGKVYVRFGEPVSLRDFLGPPTGPTATDPATRRLALQKTAFEVAWRINHEMPVTAAALVTTILLAVHGTALTFGEIRAGLVDSLAYLEERNVPRTASLSGLATEDGLRATLRALTSGGPVTCVDDGTEPVWSIEADQQLAAAFYRNSLIHVVLDSALCELALQGAGEAEPGEDRVERFWADIGRLRDLLKFEFYFKDRDTHHEQIAAELARHDPRWLERLCDDPTAVDDLLSAMRPLTAHLVLRPFLEAYLVVADVLAAGRDLVDEAAIVRRALGLGRQYVAQGRVRSTESVSVLLFRTALELARHEGLLEPARDGDARDQFRSDLRGVLRRMGRIEHVAADRYRADARVVRAQDT